jgi:hypothetical protein
MQSASEQLQILFDPALHSHREVPVEQFLRWVSEESGKMGGQTFVRLQVPNESEFTFALVRPTTDFK